MIDERRLWQAVLEQAVIDLRPDKRTITEQPGLRYCTRLWFSSNNHEPGSFRWICDYLDINPSWFRRQLFAIVDVAPSECRE